MNVLHFFILFIIVILCIALYYNNFNERFYFPIILFTALSIYIGYSIGKAFGDKNSSKRKLTITIIILKIFIAMWCIEHDIIIAGLGIEKYIHYLNNVFFNEDKKL